MPLAFSISGGITGQEWSPGFGRRGVVEEGRRRRWYSRENRLGSRRRRRRRLASLIPD